MNGDIARIKRVIVPILKKNDVVRAGIFGSYARGEAKKKSDIDLLVQFGKTKSFLDVVRVERELGEMVGRKVDLVEYGIIHPKLKDRILKEEVKVM